MFHKPTASEIVQSVLLAFWLAASAEFAVYLGGDAMRWPMALLVLLTWKVSQFYHHAERVMKAAAAREEEARCSPPSSP